MPCIRDAAYYEDRLKRDFPAHYRKLVAGKYQSVREASIAAGLVKQPTRFSALRREWKGASKAERAAFKRWIQKVGNQP